MVFNNSAQLPLPHSVSSGLLVCILGESPRVQKRGAERKQFL